MDIYIVIGGLLVLVGAVFILDSIFKKNKIIKNRTWSVIIGVALIAVGFFGTGFGAYISDWTADETPSEGAITTSASFDITPSVSSSEATLNSDEDTFVVAAYANTTAHTITESDNTTWVDPVLQFVCTPITPAGANADSLATIYYEVVNPEVTTTDGTDTYKLFTKSGGNRQLIWGGDGTHYVDATSTMLMTENVTLTLTMTCSQDSFSRMENTYDPVTVTIRFSNGAGWSETYAVEFMLVHTYA